MSSLDEVFVPADNLDRMASDFADEIQIVLFDLGGVLVELQGVPTMLAWLRNRLTAEDLWQMWLASPTVRAFETGRISPDRFALQVVREMSLPVTADEFLTTFTGWITGLYPGALELVGSLPSEFTRATLANTSELHWPLIMHQFGLERAFHHHFPSHLTGRIKPDQEAFQHVIATLGCNPGSVFFLDDNGLNIDAAKRAGMQAAHVRGPEEARNALIAAGIINTASQNEKTE